MKSAIVLTVTLLLAGSMAVAEGASTPAARAAALKQLQTVAPGTVTIPGVAATDETFVSVLGAMVAVVVFGGDAGTTSIINPSRKANRPSEPVAVTPASP